jgi:hypothetical protein
MKMEFPFCNLLKMTASEGRERDVKKNFLIIQAETTMKIKDALIGKK